ncbi:M57 family metalloprotease [Hyalangium minutum]|nr:M57 family metalloprotease [Hyalangium minutum]
MNPKIRVPFNATAKFMTMAGVLILGAAGCGSVEERKTPPSWEEFERDSTRSFEGTLSFVVEGDLPLTHEELRDYYERNVAAEVPSDLSGTLQQPLIVNRVNSQDDIWNGTLRRNLRYCVSNEFGARKSRAVFEMSQATSAWEAVADVDFIYDPTHDANCHNGNAATTFSVRPWSGGGACAFFPSGGGCVPRTIVIDMTDLDTNPFYRQNAPNVTTLGVLRHELGHVLGFRHEHIRVDCYEDSSWRALTTYDASSVMHYPWCNGVLTSDLSITNLDAQGVRALYSRSAFLFNGGVEWLNGPYNYSGYQFHVADVTGDGRAEVVGINPADERAVVWASTGGGFSGGVEWLNGPYNYSGYQFHVADVNGDGRADVVGINPADERAVVWASTGGGFSGGVEWLNGPYNYSGYQFHVADVTGDGRAEVVGISAADERAVVWASTGGSFSGGVEWLNGPYNYSGYQFHVADVNRDGRAEVVGISPADERAVVWASTGGSFSGGVEWLNGPYNYSGYQFHVADVTGDGRAEVVGISAADERAVVWASTGGSFSGGVEWLNGPYNYSGYQFRVADVTGGGGADVVGINPADERAVVWTGNH